MDPTEATALAREFAGGSKEAFGKLYDAYLRPIYNFIYYKTHHRETAEDLTSQVFLKAYRAAGSYRSEAGTFQAWLYQIARHTVIDHYRSAKFEKNIEDVWDLSSNEDLEADVDVKIKADVVKKYLKDLTSEQRDIVIMRIWQEMSYVEIAEVIGKSEASCKMSFSRTMKKLRETMPEAALIFLFAFFLNK